MLGSIVGLLASIIGGAVSSSASKDYAQELEDLKKKQKISSSLQAAENIYEDIAGRGLPGYEQQKAEIESSIPTTLNQARDFMQGGQLVDALTSIYSKTQGQKRELSRENDAQRLRNQQMYAGFLGTQMAGAEERLQGTQTAIELAQAREKKQSSADQLAFATAGAGNLAGDDLTQLLGGTDLSGILSQLLTGGGTQTAQNPITSESFANEYLQGGQSMTGTTEQLLAAILNAAR